MKKSILITLLASTALLVGCSKNEETKTSSSESSSALASSTSSESSASSSEVAKTTELKMNLAEVEQGDFESIQGTWENAEGESFTISGNTLINAKGRNFTSTEDIMEFYELTYDLSISETIANSPYLSAVLKTDTEEVDAGFSLAEAGTKFTSQPGSLNSLEVLSANQSDYSDTSKDRMYFIHLRPANVNLTSEHERYFYYRQ